MTISSRVLRVLREEQIPADELYRMLDEVAFTSIRGCNRRYFQWLFRVENNVVQDMQRLELVEVGRGRDRMQEEHDACHGEGCRACGWVGSVLIATRDRTAAVLHHAAAR